MSVMDDDAAIIAVAREGFLDEANDMLAQFEQSLLVMETDPADAENLNAAFRAAHTIKGTAGLFGCDAVVGFTHEVETLLEALRSGSLAVTEAISAALLESLDQMAALLDEVRTGSTDPDVADASHSLGERLRALRHASPIEAASVAEAAAPPAAAAPADACWHLSLRFGPDALRNGLDPLAFLRYLATLGRISAMHTLAEAVPPLQALDAEACHLGFELRVQGDLTRAEIESVFEFAMDDLSLAILGPETGASDYQALLTQRSDDDTQREALTGIWCAMGMAESLWQGTVHAAEPAAIPHLPNSGHPSTLQAATPSAAPATTPGTERKPASRSKHGEEARFVKVRADKLDKLIDLIGELVIASSGAQMLAQHLPSAPLQEASQRVSDLVQSARDGTLALRMVPVGETFARFQRIVRDVSKQLGKDIELVVTGGDTELDKSMIDVIADPLVHLVRNSLDHGIEPPDEREAAGKPRTGRLHLNAYHEAGSIVIEVRDDGRGLRRDRIVAKALERGLIDAGTTLSDEEVWQLIFMPGFSTADQVTDLSGRGVGMDVVKRNIESLRGQISLSSVEGHGTTTQVRLPLTLAMIDGFLTLVGATHYVLPLAVVAECIDLPADCAAQAGRVTGTFDLRGEVLPYLDLALFYDDEHGGQARRRSLVIVREGLVRIGLVVDRLLGEHQTVIKPLPAIFKPLRALAGSTILGSGDVALVLDLAGLMAAARSALPAFSSRGHRHAAAHAPPAVRLASAASPEPHRV
ncbi:chemotaxis protein CheA [Ideonella sp.]|uniref:chemotaxis protein CheA n=1 Tax=Ideonella sp. TaxID=1929293 RepID=UPI003BB703FD